MKTLVGTAEYVCKLPPMHYNMRNKHYLVSNLGVMAAIHSDVPTNSASSELVTARQSGWVRIIRC